MESWYELNEAYKLRFKIAVISLAGIFIENILLAFLHDKLGINKILIKTKKGSYNRNIFEASPYDLINEAIDKHVIQTDEVRVALHVIHFFRNRGHPGVEIAKKYKLTERIAGNIKVLAEKAVEYWAKQIDAQNNLLNALNQNT